MGANATTFVPAYVSGEVLTAADLTVTNSGIPVFADSTARDNSFGGTGEKVLAEGQFAYLESTNATQYYDGAAWQPVGLTGLTPISTVTISAASTTNINNVFTSTYKNYFITSNLTTSANTGVSIRLRASGTDATTANYGIAYTYNSLTTTNPGSSSSTAQTQFNFHISNVCRAMNMNMVLFNPQIAEPTLGSFNNINADNAPTGYYNFAGGCTFTPTTQFDGFSIYTGGAPTISGTIQIYGLAN